MSTRVTRVYETVPDFFVQDKGHDGDCAIPPHFGLLDPSKERWSTTTDRVKNLNENATGDATYKLVIAGRHGQGYHNLAELKYGTKCWDEYWAKLDNDDEIVWGREHAQASLDDLIISDPSPAADPLLTSLGEDQARDANAMWVEERAAGIPIPDGLYCSPMTRALQTCRLTFAGIVDFSERRPLILENAREVYGVHSCDKRRSRSYIQAEFPEFNIEEGFSEEDELYDPSVRETQDHVEERAHSVLDHIFNNDDGLVISITAHSAFIRGLLSTANHAPMELATGGVVPFVLKSTIIRQ